MFIHHYYLDHYSQMLMVQHPTFPFPTTQENSDVKMESKYENPQCDEKVTQNSSKKRCLGKCAHGERKNLRCKRKISSGKNYCEAHAKRNIRHVQFARPLNQSVIEIKKEDDIEVRDAETQTEDSDDDYPELLISSNDELWIDSIPSYIA